MTRTLRSIGLAITIGFLSGCCLHWALWGYVFSPPSLLVSCPGEWSGGVVTEMKPGGSLALPVPLAAALSRLRPTPELPRTNTLPLLSRVEPRERHRQCAVLTCSASGQTLVACQAPLEDDDRHRVSQALFTEQSELLEHVSSWYYDVAGLEGVELHLLVGACSLLAAGAALVLEARRRALTPRA